MKREKQPLANTAAISAKISDLHKSRLNNWRGFKGNESTFIELQNMLKPERDYLGSFWTKDENGENESVSSERFIPWNCLAAFDDLPRDWQDYATGTGEYNNGGFSAGFDKYDIFHKREMYLETLQDRIFSLYHSWHFSAKGWTAF